MHAEWGVYAGRMAGGLLARPGAAVEAAPVPGFAFALLPVRAAFLQGALLVDAQHGGGVTCVKAPAAQRCADAEGAAGAVRRGGCCSRRRRWLFAKEWLITDRQHDAALSSSALLPGWRSWLVSWLGRGSPAQRRNGRRSPCDVVCWLPPRVGRSSFTFGSTTYEDHKEGGQQRRTRLRPDCGHLLRPSMVPQATTPGARRCQPLARHRRAWHRQRSMLPDACRRWRVRTTRRPSKSGDDRTVRLP